MKKSGTAVPGFKMKDGKLVKAPSYASVSEKLKRGASKKVKVVKRKPNAH
jgi:hypothetical protein